jgi:hypothetical protein
LSVIPTDPTWQPTTHGAVPAAQVLNDLDYDWPVGFARFELAAWEPERDRLTAGGLAQIAQALGHDVRQIMTHI